MQRVSKSSFKKRVLEYLRQVERTGKEMVVTDRGEPVLKISRHTVDPVAALENLRGSVLRYDDPTEPVGLEDCGPVPAAERIWEKLGLPQEDPAP